MPRLADLTCKIASGATPKGGKNAYLGGDFFLIRSQNVLDFFFKFEGLVKINNEQANSLSNVEVFEQDVLLNITGDSVARCCQVDPACLPARVNQHVCIIRPIKNKLDPKFLKYYLLESTIKQHTLLLASAGATRNALTKAMIEDLEIPNIEISHQKKIAHILNTLDKKIETNKKMNVTLEKIAEALFKSWFIDFDPTRAKAEGRSTGLPEEINDLFPNSFEDSQLGEIPKGWQITTLPNVIDFLEGPGIRNWQYTNDETGIRFINIRCINKDGDLTIDTANRITEEEANGKYGHFALQEDDIVVSASGTLGRHAFIRSKHLPLNLNTSVIRFRPIEKRSTLHFLSGFVQTQLQLEIEIRASGSVQRNFGPMHLNQIKIVLPSFPLLSAHQNLVEPLFKRRQVNLDEIDVLSELRDTLLSKLISGELRITDDKVGV